MRRLMARPTHHHVSQSHHWRCPPHTSATQGTGEDKTPHPCPRLPIRMGCPTKTNWANIAATLRPPIAAIVVAVPTYPRC